MTRRAARSRFLAAAALVSALGPAAAPAAAAGDGVVEINQARALAGSVTTGDAPGFPVTLSASGSYRLTSNLGGRIAGTANTSLIVITADHVDLDLGGFTLFGPASCSGTPTVCAGTGSGRGVDASAAAGVAIHGGVIEGMGSNGVFAGSDSRVFDLTARGCGGNGVFVGNGSVVHDVVSSQNGGGGIVTALNARVRDSAASRNGGPGVNTQSGAVVSGVTASANGGHGISAASQSLVDASAANDNDGDGIRVASGSTVRGSIVRGNDGNGISSTGSGNFAYGVNVRENGGSSLLGLFVYQESMIGCSSTPGTSAIVGPIPMSDGANGVTVCITP
jgi:hypothetical protein